MTKLTYKSMHSVEGFAVSIPAVLATFGALIVGETRPWIGGLIILSAALLSSRASRQFNLGPTMTFFGPIALVVSYAVIIGFQLLQKQ